MYSGVDLNLIGAAPYQERVTYLRCVYYGGVAYASATYKRICPRRGSNCRKFRLQRLSLDEGDKTSRRQKASRHDPTLDRRYKRI